MKIALPQFKKPYDIPFVPSADDRLKTMIALADVHPEQFAADLGAGDGRVIVALAKAGAFAYGFEIDLERSILARQNIVKENLQDKAFVYNLDFWKVDFSPFNIITVYGITSIMERLEEKLQNDLKPGSKVISNLFEFPRWQPARSKNNVSLYIKS